MSAPGASECRPSYTSPANAGQDKFGAPARLKERTGLSMTPKANMIIACDQVILDAATGKKSLIGLFDFIWTKGLPAEHGGIIFLFARVKAAPGQKVIASWRIAGPKNLLGDHPMGEIQMSPEGAADLVAQFQGLVFKEHGMHRFILLMNDVEVAETTIDVKPLETISGTTVH